MSDDPRSEALRSIFRDGVVHRIGEEDSEKAARHNAMAFVVNNSPMIFAAPDMLEALEACERYLSEAYNNVSDGDEEHRLISAARAAIAKAKGVS